MVFAVAPAGTLAVLASGGSALAQTSQWVGGNSADWNNASHWSPSGVPGASDTVNVTSTAGATQAITYDYTGSAVTLDTLTLGLTGGSGAASETITMSANNLTATTEDIGDSGSGNNGSGTFNQTGGVNTIANGGFLYLASNPTDKGLYNLSAGSLSAPNGVEFVGDGGTGTFNQSGGTNTISNGLLALGGPSGSTGTYTLSNTGSLSTELDVVGDSGTGVFNQTGGTNTVTGGGELDIGDFHNSIGTYSLSAGTTTVNGNAYLGGSSAGGSGTGTLTVSNTGQMTVTGTLQIYPGSQNVLTLSGGTLTAAIFNLNSSFNQFVWTSGTLDLTGAAGENITIDNSSSANFSDSAGTADSFTLGAGQTLEVNGNEFVGFNSTGTFTQTGGTNTITGNSSLFVGEFTGASGTYSLGGNGSLSITGTQFLGYFSGTTGTFILTGSGSLSVSGSEVVGSSGTGIFE